MKISKKLFSMGAKKVLACGLSAAMVVAFAPAVAFGDTNTGSGSTDIPGTTAGWYTVATVTYTNANGSKSFTEKFESNAAATDDEALQRAIDKAAVIANGTGGYKNVQVNVLQDVTVGNLGRGEDKSSYKYAADTQTYGLIAGKNVVIDLNGHTLTNAIDNAKTKKEKDPLTVPTPVLAAKVQPVTITPTELNKKVTVFMTDKQLAAFDAQAWTPTDKIAADADKYVAGSASIKLVNNQAYELAQAGAAGVVEDGIAYKTYVKSNEGEYKAYELSYKVNDSDSVSMTVDSGQVTIKNGAIKSVTGKSALVSGPGAGTNSVIVLDNVAVTSDKAAAAISGKGGVTLQGGASVKATLPEGRIDGDFNGKIEVVKDTADVPSSLAAINVEGTVTVPAAAKGENAYQSVATVSAELDKAKNATAAGIKAGTVNVNRTIDVTAKATAAPDETVTGSDGTTGPSTGDETTGGKTDIGIINPNPSNAGTQSYRAHSYAVSAGNVALNYGNYTADHAVKAATGSIKYGNYSGYVSGKETVTGENGATVNGTKLNIYGGVFTKDPAKSTEQNCPLAASKTTSTYENAIVTDTVTRKVAAANNAYYVYKLGVADTSDVDAPYISVSVPKDAKDAQGKPYTSLNGYVQDKFLQTYTEAAVAKQDTTGVALTDGNNTDTINLDVDASYVNIYNADAVAKNQALVAAAKATAEANKQSVQGVYKVAAQLTYGVDPKTNKPIKYADVEKLAGADLAYKVYPVTLNANAQAWAIDAQGNPTKLATSEDIAVTGGSAGYAYFNGNVGGLAVTYTSISDASGSKDEIIKDLNEQIANLNKQIADLVASGTTSQETITVLNQTITSLNKQIEELKAAGTTSDTAIAELTKQVIEATQAAQQAAAQVKAAANEKAAAEAQLAKVKAKSKAYKAAKLAKAKKTFKLASTTGVTYAKAYTSSKKVTINKKGTVTVKKGAKKGTYKLVVVATCKSYTKTVTVTVKVK